MLLLCNGHETYLPSSSTKAKLRYFPSHKANCLPVWYVLLKIIHRSISVQMFLKELRAKTLLKSGALLVNTVKCRLRISQPLAQTTQHCFKSGHYNLFRRSLQVEPCRAFHTSPKRPANPLFLLLLKTKGLKVLKGLSIILGRVSRRLHDKLPEPVRAQVTKHKILLIVSFITVPSVVYYSYTHYEACPITARKRWITFTKDQVLALSDLDYQELMKQYSDKLLSPDHPLCKKNWEIIERLRAGNSDLEFVKTTSWNLNVIDDAAVTNAFVLPNGQIFVFTGMLKMLNTWEEMAVILGHEMAHAVLGHSQEQQSYLSFGELLAIPILAFIWFYFEDFAAFLIYTIQQYLYPMIFEFGFNLPYSRLLETEADEVGLLLAAKACFDPRWSVLLWEKMAMKEALEENGSAEDFDYLSTHPGNQKRSTALEQRLPEILEMRKRCNCPPLPENVNPEAAAQHMRKCVSNIKERTSVREKLQHNSEILQENNIISTEPLTAAGEKELAKLKAESETLSKKLQKLEAEYNLLINVPELKTNERNQREQTDQGKEGVFGGVFNKLWYKVIGEVATTGKLKFTLFEKEIYKLNTVDVKKSAFGKN